MSDQSKPYKPNVQGPKTRKPKAHITLAQWEEIKAAWEMGTKTLSQLSQEYGIRPDSLCTKLKRAGVKKGARAHEIGEAARQATISQGELNAQRAVSVREQVFQYSDAIAKLTMKKVVDKSKDNTPGALEAIEGDIKVLHRAMDTIAKSRNERWIVLGLDKMELGDDDLPALVIGEMTADQIAEVQAELETVRDGLEEDEAESLEDEGDFEGDVDDLPELENVDDDQ